MESIVLYARVSSKEQGKSGIGIQSQIDEMKAYAAANNMTILDIRTEVVSGKYHLDRRPVLKKAFEDAIKAGARVCTAKLDRLSRNVEFIGYLTNQKLPFFTCQTGKDCDNFIMHVHASMAEEARKSIIKRALESSQVKRSKGIPMGNDIPSVRVHSQIRIERSVAATKGEADNFAEYMKARIKRMRDAGMSVNAIADELNYYKQPTQRGGKWWPKTVSNLMARW